MQGHVGLGSRVQRRQAINQEGVGAEIPFPWSGLWMGPASMICHLDIRLSTFMRPK